jgi:hypothetical protein
MAGTLNVTTISGASTITGVSTLNAASGVLATQNGMTGIAKAWVNFVGSSGAINGTSFNISLVTKLSTGSYTVNFTTAMPNANYAVAGSCATPSTNYGVVCPYSSSGANLSTTSFPLTSLNSTFATFDATFVTVAVFGS